MKKRRKNKWIRKVDNRSRWQGDTDLEKKIIRVNKKKSKKKSTIIDTIYHEEMHAKHPKMHEKTVRIETKNKLKRLSEQKKKKLYNMYR